MPNEIHELEKAEQSRRSCSVPDCEYMNYASSDKCWAHFNGKNPVMTLEQYQAQVELPTSEWKDSLGQPINWK